MITAPQEISDVAPPTYRVSNHVIILWLFVTFGDAGGELAEAPGRWSGMRGSRCLTSLQQVHFEPIPCVVGRRPIPGSPKVTKSRPPLHRWGIPPTRERSHGVLALRKASREGLCLSSYLTFSPDIYAAVAGRRQPAPFEGERRGLERGVELDAPPVNGDRGTPRLAGEVVDGVFPAGLVGAETVEERLGVLRGGERVGGHDGKRPPLARCALLQDVKVAVGLRVREEPDDLGRSIVPSGICREASR
jgi:hypothetical protein